LADLPKHPELEPVDADFVHLLSSWFNRGFLLLRRIDWSSPADVLEKIIRYEAVHEIHGWEDLSLRLAPADRRCFAFFHPQMPDEPLIFVEVALTRGIPRAIDAVLSEEREPLDAGDGAACQAATAAFRRSGSGPKSAASTANQARRSASSIAFHISSTRRAKATPDASPGLEMRCSASSVAESSPLPPTLRPSSRRLRSASD
ncbi:MAG: malonyl-CoA decarboxylase, partial [Bauldia sp.]|nr:malonyl-CoA decarboxylase [Bauldia sp.]